MTRSKPTRRQPPAPARDAVAARSGAVIGALLLVSALTAAVPALWPELTDASRIVAVLVVAAGWAAAWAGGALSFERRQTWWLAGAGAITAALVISSLASNQPLPELLGGLGTRMGAVYWFALICCAVGASAARFGGRLRWWIAGIYAWAAPTAAFGIYQVLSGQPVAAGLLNDNVFGLAMLLAAAPALGLALTARKRGEQAVWAAVAALVAIAVVLSGARAATGALAVEAGLALALMAPSVLPARTKALRAAGITVAGLAAAVLLVVAALGTAGPQAMPSAAAVVLGPTYTTRAYIWNGALRTFATSPVVGHGPDGYQFASQRFIQPELMNVERGDAVVNLTPADPHSLPIRLLVGMGLMGLAAVGLALWGWAVAIRGTKVPSPGAGALRDSFIVAVAGFVTASLFAPWPVTFGALPAVVIGLAAAGFGRDETMPEVPAPARWVGGGLAALLFLGCAVSVFGQSSAFSSAVGASSVAQRQADLDRSSYWAPYAFETRFQVLWSKGEMLAAGTGGNAAAFHDAVDADALASAYAPALADFVRVSLAEAQRTGRTDLAWERATLDKASAMAPGVPDVLAEQLHLALVAGDKPAIAKWLAASRGRADHVPDYAQYAAQAEAALSGK